ncbi:MAG: glycosyltransferase [Deltaproteobacteria bacterium]|nr:glycosyltransferase [Deltaproteobacteria bacterium]
MAPEVSVCVPTYNGARYLREALDSVLCQDFRDFELLVIDDASRDDTAAILAEYARRDSRVRWRANERNVGLVGNFNACLREARGRYVKYLLQDDFWLSEQALGRYVDAVASNEGVTLAASARRVVDADSRGDAVVRGWERDRVADGTAVLRECLLARRNLVGEPSAVIFPREKAGDGFDASYPLLTDLEMWFRLLRQGRFAYIAEPLAAFRVHAAQETQVLKGKLAHLDDMPRLVLAYAGEGGAGLGPIDRTHLLHRCCYAMLRLVRRRQVSLGFAARQIRRHFSLPVFALLIPIFRVRTWALRARGRR